jgi:uncharacterized peroxidase-related enzyme
VAWIPWIDDADAAGDISGVYQRARDRFGFVPDAIKIFSLRPKVALAQESLRRSVLAESSTLGLRRAEMIGAVVSALNRCEYDRTAHAAILIKRGDMTIEQARMLITNWREMGLARDESAMLEFVEKLSLTPGAMAETDVRALRGVGFSEENIYDIVVLTGYRSLMNRMINGLGVTKECLRTFFDDQVVDVLNEASPL